MSVRKLVIGNRSYRGYDEERAVTDVELKKLVELARFTPSSVNAQPLKYYMVWERGQVENVLNMTKWAARLKNLKLPKDGKHPGAFIIICQDLSITENIEQFRYDAGIAAQTMLLGAVEKGLGGCILGNFDEEGIKNLFGLGEEIKVHLVVAFGKPDEKVVLTEPGEDGNVAYYRDETGEVHYVPKRPLDELILNRE